VIGSRGGPPFGAAGETLRISALRDRSGAFSLHGI
jgi:hypothetical protein